VQECIIALLELFLDQFLDFEGEQEMNIETRAATWKLILLTHPLHAVSLRHVVTATVISFGLS
jgi:hypothetical protein